MAQVAKTPGACGEVCADRPRLVRPARQVVARDKDADRQGGRSVVGVKDGHADG